MARRLSAVKIVHATFHPILVSLETRFHHVQHGKQSTLLKQQGCSFPMDPQLSPIKRKMESYGASMIITVPRKISVKMFQTSTNTSAVDQLTFLFRATIQKTMFEEMPIDVAKIKIQVMKPIRQEKTFILWSLLINV